MSTGLFDGMSDLVSKPTISPERQAAIDVIQCISVLADATTYQANAIDARCNQFGSTAILATMTADEQAKFQQFLALVPQLWAQLSKLVPCPVFSATPVTPVIPEIPVTEGS